MKSLILVIALIASACCHAQEAPHEWTDVKGRKLTGVLVAKDRKTAEIMLSPGKHVKLNLATLSKADQDYVEDTVVYPPPEVRVSKAMTTDKTQYSIDVSVAEINNRSITVEVVWIEMGDEKNEPVPGHRESIRTTVDRSFHFEAKMKRKYLGFEVVLRSPEGEIVARQASARAYERFVDPPR